MERALSDQPVSGQYFVQPEYESLLLANHLTAAKDILALTGGTVVRSVPGRTTRRIELRLPDGSSLAAYLKCFERVPPRPYRWLGWGRRMENGRDALNEWHQILALRQLGFRTATPIAAGWQPVGQAGTIQCFVITAEITGAVSGYAYWAATNAAQHRVLIRRIADLARRFHQAGFIHKDFYLDHLFVAERAGEPEVTLIDLQRVLGPRTFRPRWLVKDFGSIWFSLEKAGANRAGLMRLFKLYLAGRPAGAAERKFLKKCLKKAARLHRHKPKYGEPDSK